MRKWVVALLFYSIASRCVGAEPISETLGEEPLPSGTSIQGTQPKKPFFAFLDRPQQSVAESITRVATAVDEFFAEERVFYDETGSYIRLTLDTIHEDGGETGYRGDIKLKLRLPRTQERLRFTFESNPDEQRDDVDRTLEETPSQAAEEREYFAGFQATLGDARKWRYRPGFGIKLRSPVDMFVRLRVDRSYRTQSWLFRPSATFFSFKETGFRSDTSVEVDYQLSERLLFRSTSFIRYTDQNDYYEPSQVFSLVHGISKRRGMAYTVGVFGVSEPSWNATDYLAQIRYRHNIHSDYLFIEVIPQVVYQRENDFDPEHSLTFRVEMVFQG